MAAKTVGNSKSRASDILVTHHDDLCKALTVSETALFSLTGNLYSKRILDFRTKSEIISKGGYKGADTLMDYLEMRVDHNSAMLYNVLQAMRELEDLKDIVDKMDSWEEDMEISTGHCVHINVFIACMQHLLMILYTILYYPFRSSSDECDRGSRQTRSSCRSRKVKTRVRGAVGSYS